MKYDGGIKSFVEYVNKNKEPLHDEVIYLETERDTSMVEIAMQYTTSYNAVSYTHLLQTQGVRL